MIRSPDPIAEAARDRGLAHDLQQLQQRRGALKWLVGAGALALTGCRRREAETAASCSVIPEETAGPYPGDGSNRVGSRIINALQLSDIVRSDIRSSISGASATAAGVPLVLTLSLVKARGGCSTALAGYAVYLWHCDREGHYSMYSAGVTGENYLRGVQATDNDGKVTFTTIFPGCYAGRMPHMHFEIYRSLAIASAYPNRLRTSQLALPVDACTCSLEMVSPFLNRLRTSQLALPVDVCSAVYSGVAGYESSATNFARVSFRSDNVFSDGVSTQMATVTGSPQAGYQASLQVAMRA